MVPLYGQTPTAAKRNRRYRQFISARWHFCPNKTLWKHRQTKKSLHVSRRVRFCFSWRVAKGIDRRKGKGAVVKKKIIIKNKEKNISQSNKHFLSEELPVVRNTQVQMHLPGDRPAWCYTLGSPTHPSQKRARKRRAVTRNRRRKMRKVQMENRKRSQQRRWRKWDVSWMKVNRIGWKWKICGNAVSTEAIWWYEQGLKETVTGAAPSKRPSAAQRQLHPRSASSPLLSSPKCWQYKCKNRFWSVLCWRGAV